MTKTATDLVDSALAAARGAGADQADALLVESAALSLARRLGQIDRLERAESAELGLRVLLGRRQAVVSTGDLSAAGIARLAEQAAAIARAVPEDPYVGLAEADQLARIVPELELWSDDEPGVEVLLARAEAAEEAARARPKIVNSEGAEASWSDRRSTLGASNGFRGSSRRSSHSLAVSVVAQDGGGMERDYEMVTKLRAADLPAPETVGVRAAERAAARLNPTKLATRTMPVVYEPRVARGLVMHVLSAIDGGAVARGTTFLKDRMGEPVMAAGVTIAEEPFRPGGLRSRPFDAEGLAPFAGDLVEAGVLRTWLLDLATARQLGLGPTGHAARGVGSAPSPSATNVVMRPGKVGPEALIADIEDGLFVTEMIGMGLNMLTGDYSRGASGFRIVDGRLAEAVAGITVAGNLKDMFLALTPADDLELRWGVDAPTVRIDGLTVAGR